MTKVALVGFSKHSIKALESLPDDFDVWTAGRGWDNPTIAAVGIDLVLEVHPRELLEHLARRGEVGKRHMTWLLTEEHDFPVYTIEPWPDCHNNVVYPFEEIVAKYCGPVMRGDKVVRPFTCTMDYLMAYALYTGVEEIRIIGIEMSWDTEYYYQKPGFAFWLGMASALGVKVWMPDESMLFRPKVYHEGGQMIGRHEVERYKTAWVTLHDQRIGEYNQVSKDLERAQEMYNNGEIQQEQFMAIQSAWLKARDAMKEAGGLAAGATHFEEMYDVEDVDLHPTVAGDAESGGIAVPNRRPRHRT